MLPACSPPAKLVIGNLRIVPSAVMRLIVPLPKPFATHSLVNQIACELLVIPVGAQASSPVGKSATTPLVEIEPTLCALLSVNQTFPSAPEVILFTPDPRFNP